MCARWARKWRGYVTAIEPLNQDTIKQAASIRQGIAAAVLCGAPAFKERTTASQSEITRLNGTSNRPGRICSRKSGKSNEESGLLTQNRSLLISNTIGILKDLPIADLKKQNWSSDYMHQPIISGRRVLKSTCLYSFQAKNPLKRQNHQQRNHAKKKPPHFGK